GQAFAGDTIQVHNRAPYAKNATGVTAAVRNECQLETRLPQAIKAASKGRGYTVELTDKPAKSGKVLSIEIVHVLGVGGGGWSGPKAVRAKGELRANGKLIGSFISDRHTMSGFGTCRMLQRDVYVMGKDIAEWLESPGKDALLGDAK
ncbi:MAG: hypothetical protein P8079_11220, partial [Gammaproteobacteria bacterium]